MYVLCDAPISKKDRKLIPIPLAQKRLFRRQKRAGGGAFRGADPRPSVWPSAGHCWTPPERIRRRLAGRGGFCLGFGADFAGIFCAQRSRRCAKNEPGPPRARRGRCARHSEGAARTYVIGGSSAVGAQPPWRLREPEAGAPPARCCRGLLSAQLIHMLTTGELARQSSGLSCGIGRLVASRRHNCA